MIAGITKVRNEERIIQDTLDHFAEHCDAIYVYDDASTDSTPDICESHPAVKNVVRGIYWNPDRYQAEWETRQQALWSAQQDSPDFILYFDADERIVMPRGDWSKYDGVVMRLFDFYITEEDVGKPYTERRWIGPEYREILMIYRNFPGLRYKYKDQREMVLPRHAQKFFGGYVKHYGKAISVEEWEKTCDYYAENFPEPYKSKWAGRRGKAVHKVSDFGRPLVLWENRDENPIRM